MDMENYSEDRFNEVKEEVGVLLKSIGRNPADVPFIPLSAFEGDNIKEKSDNMTWYKGGTLMEELDKLTPPEKPLDLPLRIPIQDVYSITGGQTRPQTCPAQGHT